MKKFRKDFLWGVSTSAYQSEGAYLEEGKERSVQDVKEIPKGTLDFKEAVDHYHRFCEDIHLMAQMGIKAYRFSIAWTRIIPEGKGSVNPAGVAHYSKVLDVCLKYGIEPIVTLYHFDLPYKLQLNGGWNSRETIDAYVEYARVLFENYGDKVRYWLTINEQNMMVLHGKAVGTSYDDSEEGVRRLYQENHHMLLAQARVIKLCHTILPEAKIGPAPNVCAIYPFSSAPEDSLIAQKLMALRHWLYYDAAVFGRYNPLVWNYLEKRNWLPVIKPGDMEIMGEAKPDFLALNYYSTFTVKATDESVDKLIEADQQTGIGESGNYKVVNNTLLEQTEFGWEVDPTGFRTTLCAVYERYGLPILVTENGLGACDVIDENGEIHDDYRIDYLKTHIKAANKAVDDGVDLIGYCPWSAIDLVSTHQGIKKRYGFIYVDKYDDGTGSQKRILKESAYWYKKVIRSNGESM